MKDTAILPPPLPSPSPSSSVVDTTIYSAEQETTPHTCRCRHQFSSHDLFIMAYHGAEDGVGVGDRPTDHHEIIVDDASELVFNSPELLLDIIRMIADCNSIQSITDLSLVSEGFYNATVSERLWREMCYLRWKQKWGFHKRWENALNDSIEAQSNNTERFWYSRYRSEEEGAKIQRITAEELESLVFDFRFWLGEPIEAGDDHLKYESGLIESASREFRFLRNATEREARWSGEGPYWNARGHIIGHPIDESGIECE